MERRGVIGSGEFEAAIQALSRAQVASARSSKAVKSSLKELGAQAPGEDAEMIRNAADRLRLNPGLLSGNPLGVYTYEDPILAIAAEFVRRATTAPVGHAADGRRLQNRSWFRWALAGVRAWRSRGDMAWGALGGRTPTEAIKITELPARIAVVGDAGYECAAQARVLQSISERHKVAPFTLGVHLGDTYFAGSEAETLTNLLNPLAALSFPFASLCGNHDLYYGPAGYSATISILRQPGRYFTVEAPGWRIACLDTSLACERTLRNDGKLDEGQLAWLDRLLGKKDGRQLLLMSHHYIISDWSDPMGSLHDQLRDRLNGRVLAWYWGHEHNLVAYRRTSFGFFGACVGNGAFLEKRKPKRKGATGTEWMAEGECKCYRNCHGFWPHGWLELEIQESALKETYYVEGKGPMYRRTLPLRAREKPKR
jgi:Calcineurin-like phosphoesterase